MKRILVIGNSGGGKSTLATALAEKTGLPLTHLDALYWCGNWEHRSREEFDILLEAELQKEKWIIDGNFSRTYPRRLQFADTVIWLDLPVLACLWGATKRVFQNHGKSRPDMGGNCPEHFDKRKIELYKAIIAFNKRNRKNYEELLKTTAATVYRLRSRRQVTQFLKSIIKETDSSLRSE